MRKAYEHSAYWYAKNYGWTCSDKATYTERFLDFSQVFGNWTRSPGIGGGAYASCPSAVDAGVAIAALGACIAMDIGVAVRTEVAKFMDPTERDRMKRELMRDLRRIRRPFYYAQETERRRRLAQERRKVVRRRTTAPMPTPEAVLAAWNARKDSREAMIRLGGILDNLACHVDSCLRFDECGNVVGRNGGIRGWLKANLPELSPKYKTLMRYKALATRLRQATNTKDPVPTSALLEEGRRNEVVESILAEGEPVFEHVFGALDRMISPDAVFLDAPRAVRRRKPVRKRH